MKTKTDITLPPLPVAVPWHKGYDRESLESYARAAVEADRQGRMPSDDDLIKLVAGRKLMLGCDPEEWLECVRLVMSRYGSGQPAHTPCDAGEICIDCQPRRPDGSCPDGPAASPEPDDFRASVKKLCIAARTSGGTAGRDEGLCAALDRVEAMLLDQPATQPAASTELTDLGPIRVGNLPTMNQDEYPDLGDWWVQLRIGNDGDEVLARVYGDTPEQARSRAVALAAPVAAQARPSAQDREDAQTQAARDVLAERQRQISAEGWTPEHDDMHSYGVIAKAAACYATGNPRGWPWREDWWKPKTKRRNLVRAGALILAEIERLDRAAKGDRS